MPDYDLGTARGRIEIDGSGAVNGVNDATNAVGGLDNKLQDAGGTLQRTGAIMGGIGVVALAGFGLAIKSAGDFEQQINAIAAVSGATGKELDALRDKALQLGKDTAFSASEAAQAIEELVKAGISTEDVLNGAADAAVNLAAAGSIDIPTAAGIAANAMNSFQLSAEQLPHIVDLIAGAANASAIDVGEFAQAMAQAGTIANLNGVSFDDLAVSIAAMGNAGIKGSDAGTSLKTFLQNLQPVTEKDTQLMKDLGLITEESGNQFVDSAGKIKPMREVYEILKQKLEGLGDAEKAHTLSMLFGTDAVRASAIATQLGAEGYDKLNAAIGKVSAADVAAKRMEGLNGAIEQLKGSFETLMIQVGAPFLGAVAKVVTALTGILNKLLDMPGPIRTVIVGGAALAAVLLTIVGGAAFLLGTMAKMIFAFQKFGAAMKIVKEAQVLTRAMQLLNLTFLTNPIFLLIVALVALGVMFFILYKKSETFRRGLAAIGDFAKKVADWMVEAFGTVVDWVKKNWDILLAILTGPFGLVVLVVRRWGDKIVAAVKSVIDWIKDNWDIILAVLTGPFGLLILFIRRWGDDFVNLISDVVNGVIDWFSKLPGRIAKFLADIVRAIAGWVADTIANVGKMEAQVLSIIVRWLGNMLSKIKDWITNTIRSIAGWVVDMVAKLVEMEAQGLAVIVRWLTGMLSSIRNWIVDTISAIAGWIVGIVSKLIEMEAQGLTVIIRWLAGMLRSIAEFVWNGVTAIAGFAESVVSTLFNMGVNAVDTVWNFFSQIPGKILSALGDVGGLLWDAGVAILRGLINGAKSMLGSVKDFFQDVGDKIFGWKGPLSYDVKLLVPAGNKIMEGLINGSKEMEPKLEAFYTSLAASIADKMTVVNGVVATLPPPAKNAFGLAQGAGVLPRSQASVQAPQASGGGQQVNVTVNNPRPEAAEDSMYRAAQRLAYLGVLEGSSS